MLTTVNADIGVLGMAVMGRNLALNLADQGAVVVVYNRSQTNLDTALAEGAGRLHGTRELPELVASLARPRRILLMVRAGSPVDSLLTQLVPLLDEGDIVIDGGNSRFQDTRRREKELARHGLHFVGLGVSGGEEGARHGPSLMPGGSRAAYAAIEPLLDKIAARSDYGPCVTYVGTDGAGHFVKMVHNGIEYADMQLIAEAYDLLRRLGRLDAPAIGQLFAGWNRGPLASFLVELTARVLQVPDGRGGYLVDRVLDKAGQKGTGRWTAQVALDLGAPVPSIAAAIEARVLSAMRSERLVARDLPAPEPAMEQEPRVLSELVHDALYAGKIIAYAQGMALISRAAREYAWDIDLQEVARIWTGGCIIRARLLEEIMAAYSTQPTLVNLLLDDPTRTQLSPLLPALRRVASLAVGAGIPVPALLASLSYYDSYRAARLPQNLTQAQRDAFGAHTYQNLDDPDGPFVHSSWE